MKNSNNEYVKEWLRYAKDSMIAAKMGIKKDPENEHYQPFHTICFLCQNSAEKYLKAFLIWKGWILQKIHDLEKLLAEAIIFDVECKILENECKLLNDYITETRYPSDLPWDSIGEKEAKEAIKAVEIIEQFINKRIKFDCES